MKLSVAVISAALAARVPDAERRLAKINEKSNELIDFANDSSATDKQKAGLRRRIIRLLGQLDKIDTSACPAPGVDEDRFAVDDEFDGLCDGSGKIPSMMRSYARKFGCAAAYPRKNFLDRIIKKSHKLKLRARKAGKCPGGEPSPVDPTDGPTKTPVTNPPIADLCGENKYADCYDLTSGEIYFENQWTCRNCFRVKATYGQNTNFNAQFNAARGDFVSIKFTEPVNWQTWNHPVSAITEVGDDNVWKIDFKPDGNFMSGMIFEGNLQTSDADLFVDGNWIIDSAQHCRCKNGEAPTPPPTTTPETTTPPEPPTTPPPVVCNDPCDGRDNCDSLIDSCAITPEWSNIIGEVDGDAIYTASVDVYCKKSANHGWQSVVHMTRGTSRDQFGDRYFTVWQHADGRLKLNGPMKGNDFDEVEYWVDCDDESWTTISISQQEIDDNMLELTMYQDGEALGSNIINALNAYSGPITVYASNPYHPPATLFKVRNLILK